jgi:hypothetical protein
VKCPSTIKGMQYSLYHADIHIGKSGAVLHVIIMCSTMGSEIRFALAFCSELKISLLNTSQSFGIQIPSIGGYFVPSKVLNHVGIVKKNIKKRFNQFCYRQTSL